MISVVLVDDHALVRRGLGQLLEASDDIEVVGEAGDGDEAIAVVREHRPDVVLMDLQMPGTDGVKATSEILSSLPETRVVVLTSFSDSERIIAALDVGAVGYLLKDTEPDDLLSGIRAAARGESPLHPRVASALVAERAGRRATVELTDREREVLELVGAGLPNKVIARRLGISEKTVKAHLTRVFERIGVTDRVQAALWVQRTMGEAAP
jgi:DNA-binding NarL/FixJ family response regulator